MESTFEPGCPADFPTDSSGSGLAHDLFYQFARLGHNIRPPMRNASRGEAALMHILFAKGEAQTPSQLAELAHISPARVANVLRALEDKGYVARTHAVDDRRRVTVDLTDAGREEHRRRRAEFEAHTEAFLQKLGEDDARDAIRVLAHANEILENERKEAACDEGTQAL